MGYETNLIFVSNYKKEKTGYLKVEAILEMGKIAYNEFGKLLDKIRASKKNSKQTEKLLDELNRVRSEKRDIEEQIFWKGGEYLNVVKDKLGERESGLEHKLEQKLPFIYLDGNTQEFQDRYGDELMVATLEEVEDALIRDNAKIVFENGKPYRRFDIALKMIEEFKKECWSSENIRVILWGD